MQPAAGTQHRVLHTLQTTEFRVPMGFNTPVNADNWLSCGPLAVRRSILAVFASLIIATQASGTLISHCGRGRTFWKAMKIPPLLRGPPGLQGPCRRLEPDLIDAVDFY